MFRRILLCTDGSERSIEAARVAADLARSQTAALSVIHVAPLPSVEEPFPGAPTLPKNAVEAYVNALHAAVMERTLAPIKAAGARCEVIEEAGDPAEAITRTADRQEFDLIIVGSRGLRDDLRAELGSVSHEVIQKAHCPVLVIK
jgi:nucleotide-binding universal stress UspA family protein